MLGAICGDIIGSRFEWNNIKQTDFELFSDQCRFTDDSVHTAAHAESLLSARPYTELLHEYYRYYPGAGYGARFRAWAAAKQTAPYGSYGNGAAMRVSPVAWWHESMEEVIAAAEASAAVTHDHPEGLRGARSVAGAIFLARTGARREDIRHWVGHDCGYDLSRSCEQIRPDYSFDVTCQGTVGPAVSAFLESRSFEECLRLAISLGGDSDTLACITASIGEAFYGGVPQAIAARAWGYLDKRLQLVVRKFYVATGRELYLSPA